ncbi:hypothetical protein Patl1_27325 [Pistacia atlantica]|uniref:Uncharacterized protein n=1 Tax=Pistacia atlantica TaxID=434234 RepID=A0ACC1BDW9_9ROSI|nr:hypothetical protein Patl1_27325 [Pistacia atlantica]
MTPLLLSLKNENGLVTENAAIHWQGIRQIGTPPGIAILNYQPNPPRAAPLMEEIGTPPGIAILNYQPKPPRAAPSTIAAPGPLWSDIAPPNFQLSILTWRLKFFPCFKDGHKGA